MAGSGDFPDPADVFLQKLQCVDLLLLVFSVCSNKFTLHPGGWFPWITGTAPELLIAQAALETGWGQHMIRGQDGRNSFNLFGIKADAHWQGARALTETVEFRDGLMRRERAPFRAYNSLADSFSDYVSFLKANPRYQQALQQADNAPAFARALSEAGYATDPDYHDKIEQIMDSPRLREAVSGARQDQSDALG